MNDKSAVTKHRIFGVPFSSVYPMYVQKAERKKRTKGEVDEVICWLTGYDRAGLQRQLDRGVDFDELAKGRPMSRILRQ